LKIAAIGCTHDQHKYITVPECDVLIHTGDYSRVGGTAETANFYQWLKDQTQAKHKIFIEGNHELQADPKKSEFHRFSQTANHKDWVNYIIKQEDSFKEHNVHRLENTGVEIDGVKFWGSPYTVAFHGWAFNMSLDELQYNWEKAPLDTDVLITHGPPLGKLDLCLNGHHAGDPHLLQWLLENRPKAHFFSHIHEAYGETSIGVDGENQTKLYNVSVLDTAYNVVNQPTIITI
jgi:Icc-related predicted phosphoesterase